jgi:hypothetical protein
MNEETPSGTEEESRPLLRSDSLSTICRSASATLLSFLVLAQAGVLLSFSLRCGVSPFLSPAALILSMLFGDWLARREGLSGWLRIVPPALAVVVLALSLLLAAAFFDMSWDGLWYQQTAVYQMAHGWNPLYDPMHGFTGHLQSWVRHYAKGPWYVALALFETTSRIEWAKAAPWMALAAMFLGVFAASLDVGVRSRTAAVIAALVSLNPVVTCELASYLVDGLLISFLACFVAAAFSDFRRPSLLSLSIVVMSVILCITTKLTGLVYLCFFAAAGGLYVLIARRDLLWRYSAALLASIAVGTLGFGFNPYVTNMVHMGHPFYPWMGTAAHPGFTAHGPNRDPVEQYETPHNMTGRNRFVRFYYAIFGRPGAQPFLGGPNAALMWPFQIGWKDFHMFYFHELRIAGFGPLFSGTLLLALGVLTAALVRPGRLPRTVPILLFCTIVASLLVSRHCWWARYGPQFWWLPIVAVIAGFAATWRAVRCVSWALAAILLINAGLITAAHFQWEVEATRKTYEQLAFLRDKNDVQVSLAYFGEPYGERLRAAGVKFQSVNRFPRGADTIELISVCPGYPGAVRAVVH